MASFLKRGLTQGNISNKAKFVPRPVVTLEKSTFIKTSGSSSVLTYRMGVLFSVQIITNRRLAAWPPPHPHPRPQPASPLPSPSANTCARGTRALGVCSGPCSAGANGSLHLGTAATPSQARWHTRQPHECPDFSRGSHPAEAEAKEDGERY